MRYASIHKMNISDGPGIGVSLYVQGCALHCPGCFNESTWDFNGGKPYTEETEQDILELLSPDWMTRLSILGGEPLVAENYSGLTSLLSAAKEKNRHKEKFQVWLWTGRTWSDLQSEMDLLESVEGQSELKELLKNVDYLVDGPFVQEKKDLSLKWRGSSNQRIIALNGNKEIQP